MADKAVPRGVPVTWGATENTLGNVQVTAAPALAANMWRQMSKPLANRVKNPFAFDPVSISDPVGTPAV